MIRVAVLFVALAGCGDVAPARCWRDANHVEHCVGECWYDADHVERCTGDDADGGTS